MRRSAVIPFPSKLFPQAAGGRKRMRKAHKDWSPLSFDGGRPLPGMLEVHPAKGGPQRWVPHRTVVSSRVRKRGTPLKFGGATAMEARHVEQLQSDRLCNRLQRITWHQSTMIQLHYVTHKLQQHAVIKNVFVEGKRRN